MEQGYYSPTIPIAHDHFHRYSRTHISCCCTPHKPPHALYTCVECIRSECVLERERIERPKLTFDSTVRITVRFIPESIPPQVPTQIRRYRDPAFRSCRLCHTLFWAWCETCGYRLCASCVLRECERELGVEKKGEVVHRVRHPAPVERMMSLRALDRYDFGSAPSGMSVGGGRVDSGETQLGHGERCRAM